LSPSDNIGASDYNKKSSTNRAKAVNDYIVAQGIPQTRMTYKGNGLTKSMYSIDTETGRNGNRRTEFKIIKINK